MHNPPMHAYGHRGGGREATGVLEEAHFFSVGGRHSSAVAKLLHLIERLE